MNSNPILIDSYSRRNKKPTAVTTNIFLEMELIGMDPNPLLEIAAHDLINQYGNDAVGYSIQIERDFIDEGDAESAEIWQKISNYLQSLNGTGQLVAH
ncbi:MAG: hypothetical protein JKY84_12745 [Emcibacteraceae bacterium]|nr:hypothetical protein [Emcibacteraceae bacterium]